MAGKTAEEMVAEALKNFAFGAPAKAAERFGEGHINDTFVTEVGSKRYIVQRINTSIFKKPLELMENIENVTSYLSKVIVKNGGDPERETLNVIPAADGKPIYTDTDGGVWRCYKFIEGAICLQKVESPEDFYASARAFGNFSCLLENFPAATLHETIEKFHDTRDRFNNFKKALEADSLGRAKDVKEEIDFVLAHEKDCAVLMDMLDGGKLPLRVTHNDTKLNNVMLDENTRQGICVIDLDTVMPGLSLHDYGDSIRFGANNSAEDEPDLSKVNFSLPLFEIYTKGYLETAGKSMTDTEKEYLPWGAKLMTLECGMRFLTDHLEGDSYFRIHRPNHNLDRCRTQFKLVRDMEENWDAMKDIVKKYS